MENFDRSRFDNKRFNGSRNLNRNNFDRSNYRYNNGYNKYENTYRGNRDRNENSYRGNRDRFERRGNYDRRQSKPIIEFPVSDEEEKRTYKKINIDDRLEPRDKKFQAQQSDQKSRLGQRYKKVVAIEKKGYRRSKDREGDRSSESDASVSSTQSKEKKEKRDVKNRSDISIIRTKEIIQDVDEACEEMQVEQENSEPFLEVQIGEVETRALIDTGAQISAITKSLYDKLIDAKKEMLIVPIKKFALRGAFRTRVR